MNENLETKDRLLKELIKLVDAAAETSILEIIKRLDLNEFSRTKGLIEKLKGKSVDFKELSVKNIPPLEKGLKTIDFVYNLVNIYEDIIKTGRDFYDIVSKQKYISLAIFNTTETQSLSIQRIITKMDEVLRSMNLNITTEDSGGLFKELFKVNIEIINKIKEHVIELSAERPNFFTIWFVKNISTKYPGDKGLSNIIEHMKDETLGTNLLLDMDDKLLHLPPQTINEIPFIPGLAPVTKTFSVLDSNSTIMKKMVKAAETDKFNIIVINKHIVLSSENISANTEEFFISPLFVKMVNVSQPISDEVVEGTKTILPLASGGVKKDVIEKVAWSKLNKKTLILDSLAAGFIRILSKVDYPETNKIDDFDPKNIKNIKSFLVDTSVAEELLRRWRPRIKAYNKIIEDEFLSRAENTKFTYLKEVFDKRKKIDINTDIIKATILSEFSAFFKNSEGAALIKADNFRNSPELITAISTILSRILFGKEDNMEVKNIEYKLTIIRKNRTLINDFCREFSHRLFSISKSAQGQHDNEIRGYYEDCIRYSFEALDETPSMWKAAEYSLKEFIMENRFNI